MSATTTITLSNEEYYNCFFNHMKDSYRTIEKYSTYTCFTQNIEHYMSRDSAVTLCIFPKRKIIIRYTDQYFQEPDTFMAQASENVELFIKNKCPNVFRHSDIPNDMCVCLTQASKYFSSYDDAVEHCVRNVPMFKRYVQQQGFCKNTCVVLYVDMETQCCLIYNVPKTTEAINMILTYHMVMRCKRCGSQDLDTLTIESQVV